MYVCMCVCVCVCVCACVCVYVFMHVHTYIHTYVSSMHTIHNSYIRMLGSYLSLADSRSGAEADCEERASDSYFLKVVLPIPIVG